MRVVARCNGVLLTEDGDQLGVSEIGGGWLGTAAFVAALIAGLGSFNGVLLLAMTQWIAGAVVATLGALAIAATIALLRRRRAARTAPPSAPWLVFDLAAAVVRDAHGAVLAPLAQVTLKRTFQVGSSSKALTLQLPGRKIVLARGTPFGDSVDALEDALRTRLRMS